MNHLIARYHFSMNRADFIAKKESGHFSGQYARLSFREIPATCENFIPLLKKVGKPWGWDNKEMNKNHFKLQKRLAEKETRLFLLTDNNVAIGYTIITAPDPKILKNMPAAFMGGNKIIEIENLGLFPGEEGGGRGGKFFEMLFDYLFVSYDYVYWSMSSTNYTTLFNYYKNKMGMEHIGTDYVKDFRPQSLNNSQDNHPIAA